MSEQEYDPYRSRPRRTPDLRRRTYLACAIWASQLPAANVVCHYHNGMFIKQIYTRRQQ